MTEHVPSRLAKWPFFLSDLLMLAVAGTIVFRSEGTLDFWQMAFCLAAVAIGAWIGVTPFLKEYLAAVQITEVNALATAAAQMKNLAAVKDQIGYATAQWGAVQEHSAKTVQTAKELVDRMRRESEEFCKFFEKVNQSEKAHLRLEAEKLRRAEGDWLQVTVRILDHIFALNQAATRSGQPGLISQLGQFQIACRDVARKVGLVPFAPARDEPFDSTLHHLLDPETPAPATAQIADTLATGYTYQAQLIRKAMVVLHPDRQPELPLSSRDDPPNPQKLEAADQHHRQPLPQPRTAPPHEAAPITRDAQIEVAAPPVVAT